MSACYDKPPSLMIGILIDEVLLSTDSLKAYLAKLVFNPRGRNVMVARTTKLPRFRFTIDHNQLPCRNQRLAHVSKNCLRVGEFMIGVRNEHRIHVLRQVWISRLSVDDGDILCSSPKGSGPKETPMEACGYPLR